MSFNRIANLALASLFATSLFGCANDDALVNEDGSDSASLARVGDEQDGTSMGAEDIGMASAEIEALPDNPDDLDGEFLLAFVVNLFPDADIRFITTVNFTASADGGVTVDLSLQPLNAEECVPAGQGGLPVDVDPIVANGVPVDSDGNFQVDISGETLPADANAVLCNDLTGDIGVAGTVVDANLFCGTVDTVLPGTFGATRMVGAGLPTPVTRCP